MNKKIVEMEYITLDDGINYVVMDKISGNNNYIYLVNSSDNKKLLIQKNILENGENTLVNLDNDSEFNEAVELYNDKCNKINKL